MHFEDSQIFSRFNDPKQIYLKKELRKRFPGVDISRLELRKAIVVAKSRKGHGTVQLRVGKNLTDRTEIGGSPRTFHSSGRNSFDRLQLQSPSHSSKGPWQLLLRGNIILRKIVLVVDSDRHSQKSDQHNSYSWSYEYNSYDNNQNHSGYPENIREKLRRPYSPLPLVLPSKAWGTEVEGKKLCGKSSNNGHDGWDYPNTICESNSKATYRSGYQPTRLYTQPDIRVLDQFTDNTDIKNLQISISATAGKNRKSNRPVSATFGITINGQTFSKKIYLDSSKAKKGKKLHKTLNVSGNWSKNDLQKCRIWILPNWESGDFTISQLHSLVTAAR